MDSFAKPLSNILLSILCIPSFFHSSESRVEPTLYNWCFVKSDCNQLNPDSAWNHGICRTGKAQSPIDILDPEDIPGDSIIDFSEARYNYDLIHFRLENDGKHVELSAFKTASGRPPTFTWQDRFNSTYTLQEIHVHWGPSDEDGSEHSISGRGFAMEFHLIHYRTAGGDGGGFVDFPTAKKSGKPGALATIAIFFETTGDGGGSQALQPLLRNLEKIHMRGDSAHVDGGFLRIGELLKVQTKAVTYEGSTTTPTCDEIVTWIIPLQPVSMEARDVDAFRSKIHGVDGKPLETNRRRTQDAFNRLVGVLNLKQ